MLTTFFALLLAGLGPSDNLADDDPLQIVIDRMAEAECCRFEFISILESEVFESVDSTFGTALIGGDGRHDILLGPDRYLRTEGLIYSYSSENEQVTLERVEGAAVSSETIGFITELDRHYQILPLAAGSYRLSRRSESGSSLPVLMVLTLSASVELESLEYTDDNGDLNRIVFLASDYQSACDSAAFAPDFPEATEVIKLY